MEVQMIEEKDNVLLKRREIKFNLTYAGSTPTREEVRSKLVALLNSDKNLTVLDYLKAEYGKQTAKGYVKVYKDADGMKVESLHKIKRNFEAKKPEEKKPEEKPAEEKKPEEKKPEEKPAEDKKPEDKKPEEKKHAEGKKHEAAAQAHKKDEGKKEGQ